MTLTRADLAHVMTLVLFVKWIQFEYPELLDEDAEDNLKVVDQMIMEKLNENTNI